MPDIPREKACQKEWWTKVGSSNVMHWCNRIPGHEGIHICGDKGCGAKGYILVTDEVPFTKVGK